MTPQTEKFCSQRLSQTQKIDKSIDACELSYTQLSKVYIFQTSDLRTVAVINVATSAKSIYKHRIKKS